MAAKFAMSGASAEDVVKFVEQKRNNNEVMFIVDSLSHLRRGGRISSTVAIVGSLLNMKPVLHVKDGKLVKLTAQKGFKKGIQYLVDEFKKNYVDDGEPIYLLQAENEMAVNELKESIVKIAPKAQIEVNIVGPIVAAHCGPKTIGIVYNKK